MSGHLTTIEDGPYPQFVLHLDTPATPFNLNIESIPQSVEDLYALAGSAIRVHYTTQTERYLLAVRNPSGLQIGSKAIDPTWLEITGTLSGAESPTESDLPDTITITDSEGSAINFLEYVTEELAAVNGTIITGYYSEHLKHHVQQLEAAN